MRTYWVHNTDHFVDFGADKAQVERAEALFHEVTGEWPTVAVTDGAYPQEDYR